jgi:hypothetical protein
MLKAKANEVLDEDDDDREEGWVDPHDGMSQEDHDELDLMVHPV